MNTIRFTSKEAFIDALEERRKFWRDYDRKQAREHKAAEQKWLTEARKTLREAVKWDYAKLKEAIDYGGRLNLVGERVPSCPRLMEPKIDEIIAALKVTGGKAFTVSQGIGAWREAHNLLTWDPDAVKTAC